jgi:hypothetical protein
MIHFVQALLDIDALTCRQFRVAFRGTVVAARVWCSSR